MAERADYYKDWCSSKPKPSKPMQSPRPHWMRLLPKLIVPTQVYNFFRCWKLLCACFSTSPALAQRLLVLALACRRCFTAAPGVSWHIASRHGFTDIITRFGETLSAVLFDGLVATLLSPSGLRFTSGVVTLVQPTSSNSSGQQTRNPDNSSKSH